MGRMSELSIDREEHFNPLIEEWGAAGVLYLLKDHVSGLGIELNGDLSRKIERQIDDLSKTLVDGGICLGTVGVK